MTLQLAGSYVARRIEGAFQGAVLISDAVSVTVPAERTVEIARFLRDDPDLDCKFLNCLTGLDWLEHFDVVYVLSSLAHNHILTLKARCFAHEMPVVPSVSGIWIGANLQEREVYDLMGISFAGHPGEKRIFLWEGFPGHPLRKDFLALPGGFKPGLQRFPFEFPEGQRGYPSLANTQTPSAPTVPRLDRPPEAALPIEETPEPRSELAEQAQAGEAREQALANEAPSEAGGDPAQAGGTA
jgi:NADH-quinone oxidoreductase subunit C